MERAALVLHPVLEELDVRVVQIPPRTAGECGHLTGVGAGQLACQCAVITFDRLVPQNRLAAVRKIGEGARHE
ncbi:hypothetical protein DVA86_34820 [Streptomyces armeniacus]|uniref:Uncharacterized protein n=1 Tax=Streptomyces armeniacus TaxID=83291 RepID=A0A345XZ61_9ACTN|nr:hypothetical protein [Streptomyces armeniacus]AXK36927.1 hypothetical protein DVA86_34820 [Streptomyces armeniacus]